MKKMWFFITLMGSFLFSFTLGTLGSNAVEAVYGIDVNSNLVSGGLFALSMVPRGLSVGVLSMALDVEIWKPWIIEQLFANNEFLNLAQNADEHVLNGKIVHIPNAGSASGAKKNRGQLPATVTRRKDVDVSYVLDEFTSNPRLIENADKILSYDKMNSAMGQDMRYLKQLVAEAMLYNWRPEGSTKLIETTGASVATHLAGTAGNRKKLSLENYEEAQARMDEADIPEGDRYTMLSARMYKQFTNLLGANDARDFSRALDIKKGVVGEMFGFKFMKRSSVLRFDNALAAKDPDPEVLLKEATDNDAILCWHIDAVERAIGTTNIFERKEDPTYYGDIYSLLIRGGGRKVEQNGRGVIGIVQKNV